MKILGTFEIFEILKIKTGIVLAGKPIEGKPLSNENDVLKKNIFISFLYNEKEITTKIIRLDGRFGRPSQDILIEVNDNVALIIENENNSLALDEHTFVPTITGKILEKEFK